jgi:hypothetical protein
MDAIKRPSLAYSWQLFGPLYAPEGRRLSLAPSSLPFIAYRRYVKIYEYQSNLSIVNNLQEAYRWVAGLDWNLHR